MKHLVSASLAVTAITLVFACGSDDADPGAVTADGGGASSSSGATGSSSGASSSGTLPPNGDASSDGTAGPLKFSLPYYVPGVNVSGAEFSGNGVPGRYGYDYSYPTQGDLDYVLGKGFVLLRLPFRWARLQKELDQDFDVDELKRLTDTVTYIVSHGAYVILDPHDFGRRGGVIGSGDEGAPTNAQFADFWSRLATLYKGNDHVAFGLENEPNKQSTEKWLVTANAAIAAIRATGAPNVIAVPGNSWTGAWTWMKSVNGDTANATVMGDVVDPLDNYIYEMHQYLDEYSSGDPSKPCVASPEGSKRLAVVTPWLRERGKRAFLGEIGVQDTPTCLASLDDTLTFMDDNRDVWQGWTWWSSGARWGNYPYSITPDSTTNADRAQTAILLQHMQ